VSEIGVLDDWRSRSSIQVRTWPGSSVVGVPSVRRLTFLDVPEETGNGTRGQ